MLKGKFHRPQDANFAQVAATGLCLMLCGRVLRPLNYFQTVKDADAHTGNRLSQLTCKQCEQESQKALPGMAGAGTSTCCRCRGPKEANRPNCELCRKCDGRGKKPTRTPEQSREHMRKWNREHPGWSTEQGRRWRSKYPEKAYKKRRDHGIKARYGATVEQYEKQLHLQNGICAICQGPPLAKDKRLCIDHCHKSNKFRGLLCRRCNMALGGFQDSLDILRRAIAYLEVV